jgi:hypothetical protein
MNPSSSRRVVRLRHGSPFGPDLGLRQNHYPLWSVLTQTTIFIHKEDSLLAFPEIEAFLHPWARSED